MAKLLCEGCDLCKNSENPCLMGRGDKKAKIMMVQDCPDEIDDKKAKALCGKTCDKMRKAMEYREIDTSKVYWTSLVKCLPSDGEVTGKDVKACQSVLETEIEIVDPDIIVPLGKHSMRFCGIKGTALTKVRGNAQEVELCGKTRIILPMMHPRASLSKPIYKDYILKDLDTLKTLYDNGMTEVTDVTYRYLETLEDCVVELDRLNREAKELAFDIETTGKSAFMSWSKIVCISLSDKEHTGCVLPLYHRQTPLWGWEIGTVVKMLRTLLENPNIKKTAHNGKFDMEWLKYWLDIEVANFDFDTQLGHYLAVSEELGTQGLKTQAWEFTDMGGYDNELDKYRDSMSDGDGPDSRYNYDRIPWDILKVYAAADADCCLRLRHIFEPMIEENPQWAIIMHDIFMPASYAIMDIEGNGMKMDTDLADHYRETYQAEIDRITERLESYPEVLQLERTKRALFQEREKIKLIPKKDRTPEEQKKFEKYKGYENYKFNWGSSAQLAELLYDVLGLKTSVVTKKGAPSTNEDAMNELAEQHEIPMLLLELRKVTTLNNMFIKKLPTLLDDQNIIHPSFNISGTVTGRMSSENPNAQQIPRKAENPTLFQYQNEPKALFCSRHGSMGCMLNADYSALEMRIAGVISKDPTLLHAFQSGADLHKSTASLVWGVPVDEVPKDMRTNAKAVNFGIIYGKSGITFAKDLYYDPSGKNPKKTDDWDKAKAEGLKLVDDYLNTFSGLAAWLNNTKKFALKHGYVETMFGRRRRLPDLKSQVPTLKSNAERQCINAPIQGTGSDFTLLSLIKIQKTLTEKKLRTKLVCTVHDSIVFDVYIPELPYVAEMVKHTMEHIHEGYIDTPVPIVSELELGPSYGKMWDVDLDEVKDLDTKAKFDAWVHEKSMKKYKNEIDTFVKDGWEYTQTLDYIKRNNRPLKELKDYIIEAYSKEDES